MGISIGSKGRISVRRITCWLLRVLTAMCRSGNTRCFRRSFFWGISTVCLLLWPGLFVCRYVCKLYLKDSETLARVYSQVLAFLANEAPSELDFVKLPSRSDAVKLLESLDEGGLDEWQEAVAAGIGSGDLKRLFFSHRTFWVVPYLGSGTVRLFTTVFRKP